MNSRETSQARRARKSRPRRTWQMVNPTESPIRVTARLVARPGRVVEVPLQLVLRALSQGLVLWRAGGKGWNRNGETKP
jgi:hypothetical protein